MWEGEIFSPSIKCYRCGKPNHKALECCYKDLLCAKCKHVAKVFRSTKHTGTPSHPRSQSLNLYKPKMLTSDTQVPVEYQLFSIQQEGTGSHTKPLTVLVTVNGKSVTMEIDTGSSVSIISDSVFSSVFEIVTLQETDAKL